MKLHKHSHIMVIYSHYKFHESPSIAYKVVAEDEKNLSKGNIYTITDNTLIKLLMHNHTMAIYIQYKFHEIPSIGHLILAEDRKKSLKFRQSKGNNSTVTNDTLKQLHVHNLTMVIYIQYKFHEIPTFGYLVRAEDGTNH